MLDTETEQQRVLASHRVLAQMGRDEKIAALVVAMLAPEQEETLLDTLLNTLAIVALLSKRLPLSDRWRVGIDAWWTSRRILRGGILH
jgi:hypothetical protein